MKIISKMERKKRFGGVASPFTRRKSFDILPLGCPKFGVRREAKVAVCTPSRSRLEVQPLHEMVVSGKLSFRKVCLGDGAPETHRMGFRMGPRAGLDALDGRKKHLAPPGESNRVSSV